ncbi:MAG: hypothetical protein M1831_005428 [Alyxoria varia]|nr:MAG: hypothetical protein M1831_005428 [Alyxoria varia]
MSRLMTSWTACLVLGSAAFGQCDRVSGHVPGAPIKTTSGTVHGHRAPNATTVGEYLGIPFAKPPLEKLRFAPPEPFQGEQDIHADEFTTPVPDILPQNAYNLLSDIGQANDNPKEDCLYVNVWSKPQSGSPKKPVLVWIYGGGFQSGGTNSSAYSGQFWADNEDVVFVNFNYRLNIFGFPGAPGLTQNVGLLDQRLAIEWIRNNIEAFGGDASRIVIFGQSAGGASVDFYDYAWTQDPIIAGSILMSGTAPSFGNKKPESASKSWYDAAKKAGCGDESDGAQKVLDCMRTASQETLLKAQASGPGLSSVLGNFGPTIDDKTVFSNYTERALAGKFIQKPAIVGSNAAESGLFKLVAPGANLTQAQWNDFDATQFTCPAGTAAEFRHKFNVPVWRYLYKPLFPNLLLPTAGDLKTGAYHGAEILPMFGSSEDITKVDSTWQERYMGAYMRRALSSFANCPEHGLSTALGWPEYSDTTRTLLELGSDFPGSNDFDPAPERKTSEDYDGACGDFPYGGAPNR